MMEGGVNPKKMARSKRASSQRSKAKHSKHAHGGGHVPAAIGEKAVAEDSLPSNWERYGDESGSDEDLALLAEGEVRPRSKGADYGELLSSETPQLFDESPEMEGMTAMLLANGLGLWDWDSSYLEPASLSSQRQAARDASALLTVDLRLLGQSIARLNVAQRLFLEDELFFQEGRLENGIGTEDSSARISDSEGAAAPTKDGPDDRLSRDVSLSPGNSEVRTESHSAVANDPSSFRTSASDYRSATDASRPRDERTESPSLKSADGGVTVSAPGEVSSIVERATDTKEAEAERSQRPAEVKRFEATAAEAELDDLLDMLDNEVARISSKKGCEGNAARSSTSERSPFSSSSSFPTIGVTESKVESRPREAAPQPLRQPAPTFAATPTLSDRAKEPAKLDPSSGAKAPDVTLSQDDDFDSWLDSI